MNGDKVFVDTNVIVYAYDKDAGKKHQFALNIMKDLWHSGTWDYKHSGSTGVFRYSDKQNLSADENTGCTGNDQKTFQMGCSAD